MTSNQSDFIRRYWRIRTRVENVVQDVDRKVASILTEVRSNAARTLDNADHSIAQGVESFVGYMDKHPGFSALLNPTSVMRRITYRQTEETINRSRGAAPVDRNF